MSTQRTTPGRHGGILLVAVMALSGCSAATPVAGGSKAPEATRSAAPTIDTAAGVTYAKAFVKAMNADPFVVHIEMLSTGTGSANGQTIKVLTTMSADFAGKDVAFDIAATAPGLKVESRIRSIGKNAYVNQSGFWMKAKRSVVKDELADMVDAIRVIKDWHDLRYLGQDRVGKKDLQHFRANREIAYDSGAGFTGHYDTYDLWVTEKGVPVRVEATFTATSKKVGTVKGESVIDFTKFGGKIKIKVPKNK
jgi:hypothetical protein